MPVSENDLELLEEYLDGAVEGSTAAQLVRRLADDASLSSALQELKSQRVVRSAVWQSMESDSVAADRLLWRVRGAVRDQQLAAPPATARVPRRAWSPWRIASFGSAAAACMVVGFLVGRVGQGAAGSPSSLTSVATNDGNGTSLPAGHFTRTGTVPQVLVPISNEYGQVVRWQPFDNADQAKSFEEDLHRTQGSTMSPAAAGPAKLAAEEHF